MFVSSAVTGASILEGVPSETDPDTRYLFFLHGQIVEDKGVRPISETHGAYEYREILEAFESHGFMVISEARSQRTDVRAYATRLVSQVRQLLSEGVPPEHITIVGASKGGAIAIAVSSMLQNEDLNYVIVAACSEKGIGLYISRGVYLSGRVLSIYDLSDRFTGSCEEYFLESAGKGLKDHKEVVLDTGLGHGFHYRPIPGWLDPAVEWAMDTSSETPDIEPIDLEDMVAE